jgi:hypothetical protein
LIYKKGKIAMVSNPTKEPTLSFIYEDAVCGESGFFVKKGGKWGLMGLDGKMITDYTYSTYQEIKE